MQEIGSGATENRRYRHMFVAVIPLNDNIPLGEKIPLAFCGGPIRDCTITEIVHMVPSVRHGFATQLSGFWESDIL